MLFYCHGFTSSGQSIKVHMMRKWFPDLEIIAPTLPVSPAETSGLIDHYFRQESCKMIMGTSLGGFYSLWAAVRYQVPAILINPALSPSKQLERHIGENQRLGTEDTFIWTHDHLRELQKMEEDIEQGIITQSGLNFFLASDDELIDHSWIPEAFPFASRITFLDNALHRFSRFGEILPKVGDILLEAGIEPPQAGGTE